MLEGLEPVNRITTCRVRSLIEELDDKDKTIFQNAMENEKLWSAKALEKALRARGITIADTSIGRHRQGLCSCSKN